MRMIDILKIMNPNLDPEKAKIHSATHSPTLGKEAIEIYQQGNFDEWQCWQSSKIFKRDLVISLISLPPRQDGKWLFAGVYRSRGAQSKWRDASQTYEYHYDLTPEPNYKEMSGRLVLTYARQFRYPYPFAETCINDILLSEIYPP